MNRRTALLAALAMVLPGCGYITPAPEREGVVTLSFFQHKPEAVTVFDELIAEFEAENPGIAVVQDAVPEAETVIRTRFVKGDVPDVMSLGGSGVFGELAEAGVFRDFSTDPTAARINPAIAQVQADLGAYDGPAGPEVNGLPLGSNVSGVIYNVDLFAEYGVAVPTTWDELIAAAETFRAAGVPPVFATLGDAWTAMPAVNALSAMVPPEDFFDRREAGSTTFAAEWPEVAAKTAQLFSYAQPDRFSRLYEDGNRAFARGEAAMYLQGNFAVNAIEEFGPEFEIGTFALPGTADPAGTRLVSGIDVVLTMGREPAHEAESLAFVEFLMRPDNAGRWSEAVGAVPALDGLAPTDPILAPLTEYFDSGRVVGYSDHRIPKSVPLDALVQQFLIDGDSDRLLAELDREYDAVAARR